jgi:hypothetical protein
MVEFNLPSVPREGIGDAPQSLDSIRRNLSYSQHLLIGNGCFIASPID